MFADANSIFLPDGKSDIPLPAVILSAVELLRGEVNTERAKAPIACNERDLVWTFVGLP